MKKTFGTSVKSRSSARVGSAGILKPYVPGKVHFQAKALIRPAWLSQEHEDCYLLGKLVRIFCVPEKVNYTRTQLCEMVFGRPVVSEDEDNKLNRAMWELHRIGIVTLHNDVLPKPDFKA